MERSTEWVSMLTSNSSIPSASRVQELGLTVPSTAPWASERAKSCNGVPAEPTWADGPAAPGAEGPAPAASAGSPSGRPAAGAGEPGQAAQAGAPSPGAD